MPLLFFFLSAALPSIKHSHCWNTTPTSPPSSYGLRFPLQLTGWQCGAGAKPAPNVVLLPSNYQLQGSASTPGAGQAGNELSPLGWTPDWAVYRGGRASPSEGVNGPFRVTVSKRIHRVSANREAPFTTKCCCKCAVTPGGGFIVSGLVLGVLTWHGRFQNSGMWLKSFLYVKDVLIFKLIKLYSIWHKSTLEKNERLKKKS